MASLLLLGESSDDAILVLNDSWLTQASGDARYLKLAADNDPLTGTLSAQTISPSTTATYSLGSSTLRWDNLYGGLLNIRRGTSGTVTSTLNGSILGSFTSQSNGGTATISCSTAESSEAYSAVIGSAVSAGGDASITVDSRCGLAIAEVATDTAGQVSSVSVTGRGSVAIASIPASTDAAGTEQQTASVLGNGAFLAVAMENTSGVDHTASASADASFTQGLLSDLLSNLGSSLVAGGRGSAAQGYCDGGTIEATTAASGGFARGYATGGSIIRASNIGATAIGRAINGGQLLASGLGATVFGSASTSGVAMTASGVGSLASGSCVTNAITASGTGNVALGASSTGAIVASGSSNCGQFGPGTNSTASSFQFGAGVRLSNLTTVDSVFSNAVQLNVDVKVSKTITAVGTTGNQTINKTAGRVNIAAAGTTVTVTNSLVTVNSIVLAVAATNDATARVTSVVPAAGSFVINTVAVTAETAFNFLVIN